MPSIRMKCRTCAVWFYRPPANNRVNCESCSPPKPKKSPAVVHENSWTNTAEIEAELIRKLRAADRESTVAGKAAIYLARQLDAGGHTGSQSAALVGKLLEATEKALQGIKPADDAVDELRQRREAKAGGAAG